MNLGIYLALIALTAISFPAARNPSFLMTLAAIKCLLVGHVFMNLRRAHPLWQLGLAGFVGLFLTLFLFAR